MPPFDLQSMPLHDAIEALTTPVAGSVVMTMSTNQWDAILSAAYDNGWILLELDDDEMPIKAYRKGGTA